MQFSVLMSVYKNTKLNELKECIESLQEQTLRADEYVIVEDGAVSEEVGDYLSGLEKSDNKFKIVVLEKNVGLGNALREGMQHCSFEIIARMDTDDICVKERFEKQLKLFENDDEISVVGSNIAEFVDGVDNIIACREVPVNHKEICEFLKTRDPFNHMTVILRKTHVMNAGGYLPWHFNEDSYLWVRMYLNGAKFANINENLVYARVGADMYARRGGYKYFKSEKGILKIKRKNKVIGTGTYISQVIIRFVAECMLTNRMRSWLYKKHLRQPLAKEEIGKDNVS